MMQRPMLVVSLLILWSGGALAGDDAGSSQVPAGAAAQSQPADRISLDPQPAGGPHRTGPRRFGAGRGAEAAEPPGPDGPMLRPEEVEQFLAFSREHFPLLHDELVRARREDGREFRQMLRRVAPPMMRLMRLWREDPEQAGRLIEIQKIEMQIRTIRQRYQRLRTESERAAVRDEIRELLARRFDLRLENLRHETEQLRQRLDDQTRRLNEQERNRSRIVEEESAGILGDMPGATGRGPRWRTQDGAASRPARLE